MHNPTHYPKNREYWEHVPTVSLTTNYTRRNQKKKKNNDGYADSDALRSHRKSWRRFFCSFFFYFKCRMVVASQNTSTAGSANYFTLVEYFCEKILSANGNGTKKSAWKIFPSLFTTVSLHGLRRSLTALTLYLSTRASHKTICWPFSNSTTQLMSSSTISKVLQTQKLHWETGCGSGKTLKIHIPELSQGNFMGVKLFYKPNIVDCSSPVRKSQKYICNFFWNERSTAWTHAVPKRCANFRTIKNNHGQHWATRGISCGHAQRGARPYSNAR